MRTLLWRLVLLALVAAPLALIGLALRRLGLGEIAIILSAGLLLILVEGSFFVGRQFLRGYRAGRPSAIRPPRDDAG